MRGTRKLECDASIKPWLHLSLSQERADCYSLLHKSFAFFHLFTYQPTPISAQIFSRPVTSHSLQCKYSAAFLGKSQASCLLLPGSCSSLLHLAAPLAMSGRVLHSGTGKRTFSKILAKERRCQGDGHLRRKMESFCPYEELECNSCKC